MLKRIRKLFNKLLTGRKLGYDDLELNARITLLYIVFAVSLAVLIPYAVYSLVKGFFILGYVELATAAVLIINFIILTITKKYLLFSRLGIFIMEALFLYIFITGGISQIGYQWVYTFPLFVLFLLGPVEGTLVVLSFLLLIIIYFIIGFPSSSLEYGIYFKVNFIGSFLAVYIISNFFEYLRAKTYRKMLDKNVELQYSEQRQRDITFSSSDIIWEVDKNMKYTFASGRTLDILGYHPGELLGKTPFDLCGGAEARKLRNVFKKATTGRSRVTELAHWCLHKNGMPVFLLTNAIQIMGTRNNITGYRGVDKDITEWKQTEEALRESEFNLRMIIDAAPFGAFVIEEMPDGRLLIANFNNAAGVLFRKDMKKFKDRDIGEIFPGLKETKFLVQIRELIRRGKTLLIDDFLYEENREKRIFEIHGLKIGTNTAVFFFIDNTERILREETIRFQAEHDNLTGLANRVVFMKRMRLNLHEARSKKNLLAVLYLDLDEFKQVNDNYGHGAGDELLKLAAARLKTGLRDSDLVGRLGGDEFAIILPLIKDKKSVRQIAEKILQEFNHPFHIDRHNIQISTSIGISVYPADGNDPEELLQKSDKALYQAKSLGKNMFIFYAKDMEK